MCVCVCVFFTNDLPTTKPYEKEKKATACFALSLLDDSSLPFAEVMEKTEDRFGARSSPVQKPLKKKKEEKNEKDKKAQGEEKGVPLLPFMLASTSLFLILSFQPFFSPSTFFFSFLKKGPPHPHPSPNHPHDRAE